MTTDQREQAKGYAAVMVRRGYAGPTKLPKRVTPAYIEGAKIAMTERIFNAVAKLRDKRLGI